MFTTGGFTTTVLAGDKRWRTMPGEKVFSGRPGWYIRPVCCVKNSRIVSGVTGCDRHYPSSGTALYIDYSSVNQRCCAVNDVSGFSSVIQHHQPGAASLCSCVSLPHTVDRSGRNGHHLPLTHGNSAEIAHKTPRCFISRLLFIVQLWYSVTGLHVVSVFVLSCSDVACGLLTIPCG